MRAAPTFDVSLHRVGAWQAAVWTVVAAGWIGGLAWGIQRDWPGGPMVCGPLALLGAFVGWRLGRSLAFQPPTHLRWDGQLWWVTRRGAVDPIAGHLSVAIDLGPWMLLRFLPAGAVARGRTTWLPVQRHAPHTDWHALRCAVYSPVPPAPAGGAASSARVNGGT